MLIIPMIERLFHCKELAIMKGWHPSHRSESGVMLIPTDSISMKNIENTWLEKFKNKVRSLRLSIAMDSVNPYSFQNTNYYVWPVVVINKNIPPWLFVKNENLMLALIVSRRRKVKNMDVYLQPLVDELK
jgi:hypothetical protein